MRALSCLLLGFVGRWVWERKRSGFLQVEGWRGLVRLAWYSIGERVWRVWYALWGKDEN